MYASPSTYPDDSWLIGVGRNIFVTISFGDDLKQNSLKASHTFLQCSTHRPHTVKLFHLVNYNLCFTLTEVYKFLITVIQILHACVN